MKNTIFLLFLASIFIAGQLHVTSGTNKEINFLIQNLTGDMYCDMVKEVYLQAEWYIDKVSGLNPNSQIVLKKLVVNVVQFFWDTRKSNTKENIK